MVTTLIGLAVAAVIVERLTRPRDEAPISSMPPYSDRNLADSASPLLPPEPVQATTDELIAEGKTLADELAQSFPDRPEILALCGRILFTLGSSAKAMTFWEQATKLNPNTAQAWLGMAEYAREQGDFAKAVEQMKRLEAANPQLAEDKVFILADSQLHLGNAREVVAVLEKTGQKVTLPPWAQTMLGKAYYQLKDHKQAAEHYQKALAEQPETTAAHYGLSLTLQRLGRNDEAEKHREEYARLQKKDMVVFDRMHGYGTQQDRQSPAQLTPILAGYHVEAGRLYAMEGDRRQAESHWRRAWALVPERPEPRQLLESLDRR